MTSYLIILHGPCSVDCFKSRRNRSDAPLIEFMNDMLI
ncbi:hypothetical protein T02_14256 [Trichinella nativa]|uniref:Uncharacterized protein n=1 Tax=Trichinella nativa TaxID=6335 RepID=A0A0V1KZU8_9BILA|nr:hypothetical protein T06_12174 [Trichinella sp. T6]KRZ52809.1 hypothetical protein T02_14256 [Trichinella nativa]